MKKRLLALVCVAVIMSMNTMTVFASSPTAGTTEKKAETQKVTTTVAKVEKADDYVEKTTVSEGFKVEKVEDSTIKSAEVAVQNEILNDVAKIGKTLGNSVIESAATNADQKVETKILTVVEVDPTTSTKNAEGNFVVTLNVTGVEVGDAIVVLHYNGSAWEVIVPTEIANGSVTFESDSLSPISIVELEVKDAVAAPKTGEGISMVAITMVIGLAAFAVYSKKNIA